MQYLAELVQHGLGISILPPASIRAVTAHVATIPLTPPLRRDICAVTAAAHPPTGPAQALLDLLAADINSQHGPATKRSSGKTPPARSARHR
jgi:DNA-binding transcriptional LysR family regulator